MHNDFPVCRSGLQARAPLCSNVPTGIALAASMDGYWPVFGHRPHMHEPAVPCLVPHEAFTAATECYCPSGIYRTAGMKIMFLGLLSFELLFHLTTAHSTFTILDGITLLIGLMMCGFA